MTFSATTTSVQHRLFSLNRARPSVEALAEVDRLEREWIEPLARSLVTGPGLPTDLCGLLASLDGLLEPEDGATPAELFVAESCDRTAFRALVAEFAVDALTEAESFLPIVPRLPLEVRMPVLRVLIDEFGCGNLARAHAQLYVDLLEELGLPTTLAHHLPLAAPDVLAFVNLFSWLSARADSPAWFLGALAHLEASIVGSFACYVGACERLGIFHDTYYREHIHIDAFHRREVRRAMTLLDRRGALDHAAAWAGARLAAQMFDSAFEGAVARARGSE